MPVRDAGLAMLAEIAWIVLHGGGHESGGLVTFETVLGGLVAVLAVVGTLYYVGALGGSGTPGDAEAESGVEEPESGVGD